MKYTVNCSLSNSKIITRNGFISKYGTVHILLSNVTEVGRDNEGAQYWSEDLLKYPSPKFRATIADCELVIKKQSEKICTVPQAKLYLVFFTLIRVALNNGYLISKDLVAIYGPALLDASGGREPSLFDNSPFVRVDPSFAGKELMVLQLAGDDQARVFTLDGKMIKSSVDYPLSYEKWGKIFNHEERNYIIENLE